MTARKKLLENFFSLAFLQGANYILPLITLPYLVRVLGPSNYGIIAFALSLVQFFVIFTDYGFNLTATKQISINRQKNIDLSKIFNSVFNSKLVLLIVSFVVYLTLVFMIPRFKENVDIFLCTFGIVIGSVLFPMWFFQGIERMKFISFLNILSKVFFTITVFIFVKAPNDILLVPIFNSIGYVLSGIIALIIVKNNFKIKFSIVKMSELKEQLVDGWEVFLSTMAISLYTVCNTLILGLFTNNTIVGYYASAEKIINAGTGIITPISQTIYPHVNGLIVKSKEQGLTFIKKILYGMSGLTLIMAIVLLIFAEKIVNIVLGDLYSNSIIVVQILSFLPLIIGLSNIFGVQTMLSFGYKKAFSRILISGSVMNIVLAFILVPSFHHIGTAIGVLASEFLITIVMAGYLWKKRLLLRR